MNDYSELFDKEESTSYKLRPELAELCQAVILELFEFVSTHDEAMLSEREFEKIRNRLTKKFSAVPPKNIELVTAYRTLVEEGVVQSSDVVLSMIIKRKIRTLSGIANITVLMKEYFCPGKCIFCPTQPGMPKSYFSTQPAMMRAVRNDFSAYLQVKARMNGLKAQGHDVSKIDIRTAGGTWSAYPVEYQEEFVKGIYFALNEGPGPLKTREEVDEIVSAMTLEELILQNEKALCRCVGLWVETRPDWVDIDELKRLRRFGVTGIELGIQTTDDAVNVFNKRGHGVRESIEATRLCRNVGLKICHHVMPNLPQSTLAKDMKTMVDLFVGTTLCPDYIKIYPCMVLPYTELKEMCEEDPSIYTPYTDEELMELLIEMKKTVPEYCRIIRLLRDFPSEIVLQGSKKLNIRQILQDRGVVCRCVRCREIKDDIYDESSVELIERKYRANDGMEYFLSMEVPSQDALIALLRLRVLDTFDEKIIEAFPELLGCALIREVHVYGKKQSLQSGVGSHSTTQHHGFGRRLMERAEEVARSAGLAKIAVISAVGTREYYKKLGYVLEGTYMVKAL